MPGLDYKGNRHDLPRNQPGMQQLEVCICVHVYWIETASLKNGLKEYHFKQVVDIVAQKFCLKENLENNVLVYKIFLK